MAKPLSHKASFTPLVMKIYFGSMLAKPLPSISTFLYDIFPFKCMSDPFFGYGYEISNPSVSLSPTLTRTEKIEHYIRIKTHKLIALRFWVESGVGVLCG